MKDIKRTIAILQFIKDNKPKTQPEIWLGIGTSDNIRTDLKSMKESKLIVKNKELKQYELTQLGLNVLNKSKELILLSEKHRNAPILNDGNKHE